MRINFTKNNVLAIILFPNIAFCSGGGPDSFFMLGMIFPFCILFIILKLLFKFRSIKREGFLKAYISKSKTSIILTILSALLFFPYVLPELIEEHNFDLAIKRAEKITISNIQYDILYSQHDNPIGLILYYTYTIPAGTPLPYITLPLPRTELFENYPSYSYHLPWNERFERTSIISMNNMSLAEHYGFKDTLESGKSYRFLTYLVVHPAIQKNYDLKSTANNDFSNVKICINRSILQQHSSDDSSVLKNLNLANIRIDFKSDRFGLEAVYSYPIHLNIDKRFFINGLLREAKVNTCRD